MIKTNKTKIEWTNRVWNPITGCLNNCWYCYGRKIFHRFHKSFEPTFYIDRFVWGSKLKKGTKIFVCSVSDLFANWIEKGYRNMVLEEIQKPEYNHLIFQLLTKYPRNIEFYAKDNIWIGTTITRQVELDNMYDLVNNYEGLKFISFEPLLEAIIPSKIDGYFNQINWVIIGKLTGSNKVKLEKEWVYSLIRDCQANNIPIFLKDNLNWHEKIQEFPKIKNIGIS